MRVRIAGGGLAGVEAAYQLLIRGIPVDMYEMRPDIQTPVHKTGRLAELVCSNSLKSEDETTSQGLLKKEMSLLNSIVLASAIKTRVPAGSALAVDRDAFSKNIEQILHSFDGFRLFRQEIVDIRPYDIIATGPLSSNKISNCIMRSFNASKLYFYDAVSPIVTRESIDMDNAFYGSRYEKGTPDYINCPLNKDQYEQFVSEMVKADKVILKDFEKKEIFNKCMPIEEMAKKGIDTLRFGPLRPVGFAKQAHELPYAIVQLRKEDNYDNLYNLVGFQTNLKFREQKRIFGLIPALRNAEFARFGVMHKNIYIQSPGVISPYLNSISDGRIFFAGQILGVEGYMESSLMGIVAGINMGRLVNEKELVSFPLDTLTGALTNYISCYSGNFQPMPATFELLKTRISIKDKKQRKKAYFERSVKLMSEYIAAKRINEDIKTQP